MSFAQPRPEKELAYAQARDEAKTRPCHEIQRAHGSPTNLALFLARKLARMYSRPEKDRNVFRGFYDLENGGRILEQH